MPTVSTPLTNIFEHVFQTLTSNERRAAVSAINGTGQDLISHEQSRQLVDVFERHSQDPHVVLALEKTEGKLNQIFGQPTEGQASAIASIHNILTRTMPEGLPSTTDILTIFKILVTHSAMQKDILGIVERSKLRTRELKAGLDEKQLEAAKVIKELLKDPIMVPFVREVRKIFGFNQRNAPEVAALFEPATKQ